MELFQFQENNLELDYINDQLRLYKDTAVEVFKRPKKFLKGQLKLFMKESTWS